MSIRLNDSELAALHCQRPEAWHLYVVLKTLMDFATGMVGASRRISWKVLQTHLYVTPCQGLSDSGEPHKSKVRRTADVLSKAGLIDIRSDLKTLLFFLPLAEADYQAQINPDTNPTQTRHSKPDTSGCSNDAGFSHENVKSRQYTFSKETEYPDIISGIRYPEDKREPNGSPEREIAAPPKPKKPTARGARLTLSELPAVWRDWCRSERPDLTPERTWEAFSDYWAGIPGARGCKSDWFATWRNWCRRERPGRPSGRADDMPSKAARLAEINRRAGDEFVVGGARPVQGTVIEGEFRKVRDA